MMWQVILRGESQTPVSLKEEFYGFQVEEVPKTGHDLVRKMKLGREL